VVNPKRAKVRQQYILKRMLDLNFITQAQFDQASAEELHARVSGTDTACMRNMSRKWCGR